MHSLGQGLPRYFMSSSGLSKQESSGLVSIFVVISLRESANQSILSQVPYFPKALVNLSKSFSNIVRLF